MHVRVGGVNCGTLNLRFCTPFANPSVKRKLTLAIKQLVRDLALDEYPNTPAPRNRESREDVGYVRLS